MLASYVIRVFVAAGLLGVSPARPQSQGQQEVSEYQFWSGTVIETADGSVTVRRSSNNGEDKKFLINAETKVEGKLRDQARVTVAYVEVEGSSVAKRILVRD